jgi:hypothetical protein
LTIRAEEAAIPFAAFAAAEGDGLDVMSDEIDGTVVPVESASSAGTPISLPAYALPGRVVVAIAVEAEAAEHVVDVLLDHLGRLTGVTPDGLHPGRPVDADGHLHHDPADLEFWGQVDVERGRLASALDVTVCTHERGSVISVDAPEVRLGALVSAASKLSERRVLLTRQGPVTTEPEGSVILAAASLHAFRRGGRAVAFPGQEDLAYDVPVADVLVLTAIDDIRSTQEPYAPGAVLRAYGFVRPTYDRGSLVLTVGHDDPMIVTPWEARYCRPCCSNN